MPTRSRLCRRAPGDRSTDGARLLGARRECARGSLPRCGAPREAGARCGEDRLAGDASGPRSWRRPAQGRIRGGIRALGRQRRGRVSDAGGYLRCPDRRPAAPRTSRRRVELLSDRRARILGTASGRQRPRRSAHRDVTTSPRPSGRWATPRGHDAARTRHSQLGRPPGRQRRVHGEGHPRRRHRRPGDGRRSRPLRWRSGAQGLCARSGSAAARRVARNGHVRRGARGGAANRRLPGDR
jgi:hypothetical protein